MKIIKSGENYLAVDDSGKTVAYIKKNCFGTHGHWRGWEHYVFSEKKNDYVIAEVMNEENGLFWWRDPECMDSDQYIPAVFCNIKAFRDYYEGRQQ